VVRLVVYAIEVPSVSLPTQHYVHGRQALVDPRLPIGLADLPAPQLVRGHLQFFNPLLRSAFHGALERVGATDRANQRG
jgi:hypothetical protein